jgi:hypothetical protein
VLCKVPDHGTRLDNKYIGKQVGHHFKFILKRNAVQYFLKY